MKSFKLILILLAPCLLLGRPPPELSATGALIVIDAGHGGADEGAKVQTVIEKRLTLTTALLTKKWLERMGYRVLLTRSRDIFVPLARRTKIANKEKAAAFVSIHFNSSSNRAAKGIEIYFHEARDRDRARASKKLASAVLLTMLHETAAASRGIRKGNFHVVRETEMPAILVEGGFMTNYEERFSLKDRRYLESLARGIARGIEAFFE
jgi:N-acetylmuramoyl-L-alanine amidase